MALFKWGRKKTAPVTQSAPPTDPRFHVIQSADALLALPDNAALVNQIRELISLPDEAYQQKYLPMLRNYAAYTQHFPASRYHHHAYTGGLLNHTLEVITFALKRKDKYVIPPDVPPENAGEHLPKWHFAIFAAAMLHDFSKIATDLLAVLYAKDNQIIGRWSPFIGPMTDIPSAHHYEIKFSPAPDYFLHAKLNPMFIDKLMSPMDVDWLSRDLSLIQYFMHTISGDYKQGSIIGEITQNADKDSAARSLNVDAKKMRMDTTAVALHDRILQTIRSLLGKSDLPLNRKGAAGFVCGNYLFVVSKRFLDLLVDTLIKDGHSNVPTDQTRIMSILTDHNIAVPAKSGQAVKKATVQLMDEDEIVIWDQSLTMLQLNLNTLVADIDNRPAQMSGRVVLEDVPDKEQPYYQPNKVDANASDTASTSTPASNESISTEVAPSTSKTVNTDTPEHAASSEDKRYHAAKNATSNDTDHTKSEITDDAAQAQSTPKTSGSYDNNSDSPAQKGSAKAPNPLDALNALSQSQPKAQQHTDNKGVSPTPKAKGQGDTDKETEKSPSAKRDGKSNDTKPNDASKDNAADKKIPLNKQRSDKFIQWLKLVVTKESQYNHTTALIHVVKEDKGLSVLLVTPRIFKKFAELHGEADKWSMYQKAFLSRNYHYRFNELSGPANFTTYEIAANRGDPKKINVLKLKDWRLVFDSEPMFNPKLRA